MTRNELLLLNDLLDLEDGLTEWEVEFLEDLAKDEDRTLTPRQKAKLEQIGEERL